MFKAKPFVVRLLCGAATALHAPAAAQQASDWSGHVDFRGALADGQPGWLYGASSISAQASGRRPALGCWRNI
jgi:hypothetical protein